MPAQDLKLNGSPVANLPEQLQPENPQPENTEAENMSYAAAAAKGPKQTDEEKYATQLAICAYLAHGSQY